MTQHLCSSAEREVLEMVKCWPGVPAIVTFTPPNGWNVSNFRSGHSKADGEPIRWSARHHIGAQGVISRATTAPV